MRPGQQGPGNAMARSANARTNWRASMRPGQQGPGNWISDEESLRVCELQ